MVKICYQLFVIVYPIIIRIASLWNQKASEWLKGRSDQSEFLSKMASDTFNNAIWVQAASSGEYLQVLPVMKAYKKKYPHTRYVLTFFSPSGYEYWKSKSIADAVGYLPWEGSKDLDILIESINPKAVWVVKNEFWFNISLVRTLKQNELLRRKSTLI